MTGVTKRKLKDKTVLNGLKAETRYAPKPSEAAPKKQKKKELVGLFTEEILIAYYYGKKPSEMCKPLQEVFNKIKEVSDIANVKELKLLVSQINLVIKTKIENEEKSKRKINRNFYQVRDKRGLFSWYLRERGENGKLEKIRYFGLSLPEDINPAVDKVNFHPRYILDKHSEWIK